MDTMAVDLMNQAGPTQTRIVIADDQPDVLEALRLLLKGHGYTTEAVTSPAALLDALGRAEFDLILMDLNYARGTTSGREGLDILKMIFRQGLFIIVIGLALGIAMALAAARLFGSFLAVSPMDPPTYIAVSAILATVALAACYMPARRAMNVDPMIALHYE